MTPNSAVGYLFFDEVLRKFLAYQLKQIGDRIDNPSTLFVDELFARFGDEVRLQVRKWFVSNTNIGVVINYPRHDMPLPFVSIVTANETEGQAYLGDYGGRMLVDPHSVQAASSEMTSPLNVYGQAQTMPDSRPRASFVRRLISIPEMRTTQMIIGTDDPNTTLYLYTMVKALIVCNKMDLDQYVGARNLKVSGADLEHQPELYPSFAYFKGLTLSYEINFDVPLQEQPTIGGFGVSLGAFINGSKEVTNVVE
jgi:hypothetical protein